MNHNLMQAKQHPVLSSDAPAMCNGERPTIEMMGITADRLRQIEIQVGEIHDILFGPMPEDCVAKEPSFTPSIRMLAEMAFDSSNNISRQCEDIRRRLVGG